MGSDFQFAYFVKEMCPTNYLAISQKHFVKHYLCNVDTCALVKSQQTLHPLLSIRSLFK